MSAGGLIRKALLVSLILLAVVSVSSAYYIKSFQSEIHIRKDGSYRVAERIVVDFGSEARHGIYRNIPYKYKLPVGVKRTRLVVLDVSDDAGSPYKKRAKKQGNYINIRIGSPNRTVSGTQVYNIHYIVENGMLYFDDHDELYWNVTGTEWECDIREAVATVYIPEGMPYKELKTRCFSGPYGSTGSDCGSNVAKGMVQFWSKRPLAAFDNLSIVLGMPKGYIGRPGVLKWISWYLADLWPFLIFIFGTIWLVLLYVKRGRDALRFSVAPRYDPPEGLTPAESGTVIDEKVDIRDITSTIIDLAVRGYIKIIELEKKKILILKTTDYVIVRLKGSDDSLKAHEKIMFEGLFDIGSIEEEDKAAAIMASPDCEGLDMITISSLKEKFYTELPKIKDALYDGLVESGMFPSRPDKIRNKYNGYGFVLAILGFALMLFCSRPTFLISLLPLGILTIIFGRYMPRKTKKGSIAASHVAGFEEFVRRVEKDRIERMAKDDPTVFERLLPYAMALGVADQWAEAFADLFKESPAWFVGRPGTVFYPYAFVNSMGNAVDTVGSAMSSRPRSSGASGGHSGFGGGGFSGGGFGGGGGGAW